MTLQRIGASRAFRHRHRVTYAECTVGDHVYHSRYLDILEAARGEFFRAIGRPLRSLQEEGLAFPVLECRLRFQSPARYDDELDVEVWLSQLDRLRLSFEHRIVTAGGRLIVEATTHHVTASTGEKPRRMPPDLVELLLPHLRENPAPDAPFSGGTGIEPPGQDASTG